MRRHVMLHAAAAAYSYVHIKRNAYSFLMNNKREISVADLTELLVDNDITNFDPVYEAFKAYDTGGEGYIPQMKLREMFSAFGLGEVSNSELEILTRVCNSHAYFRLHLITSLQVADVDGDGVINLDDFRYMLEMHKGNISKPVTNTNQASSAGDEYVFVVASYFI